MWSDIKHKAIINDSPDVVNAIRDLIKYRPVSEERPIKGSISHSEEFWRKRVIEEFILPVQKPNQVVKTTGIDILTNDSYQITYYLNGKFEGKKHTIAPRYLLGRFGDSGIILRLIAFDLILDDQ